MDNTIKIWALDAPAVQDHIKASYKVSPEDKTVFRPLTLQFPAFNTDKVHTDYVDAVAWVGNMLLSKSTESQLTLWCPDPTRKKVSECDGAGAPCAAGTSMKPFVLLFFSGFRCCGS